MVSGVRNAPQHVDVEVAYARAALAIDVGEDDGGRPSLESDPAPYASRIICNTIIFFTRRQLHVNVFPGRGKDSS